MKHLKIVSYLLIMVAFFTSCEKESAEFPVNSEMNVKEIKAVNQQGKNSISAMIKSGIDIDSYFKSLTKTKRILPASKDRYDMYCSSSNYPQFFEDVEDFDCDNLLIEDFEDTDSDFDSDWIASPLDENSDNDGISPGDILPGISFESYGGFYISDSHDWGNVLMPDDYNGDITINFTTNDVYDVSMMLYGHFSDDVYVNVYDLDDNYIGGENVHIDHYDGGYFGLKSNEAIGHIRIYGYYNQNRVGIGSVSFGLCSDSDGDGCLSDDDEYPHSNMAESLSFGCDYMEIENSFVDCGTTMMDQIDELINEINMQYNGENWDDLHTDFTRGMSRMTYYWSKDRLITRAERSYIYNMALDANIPFYSDRIDK